MPGWVSCFGHRDAQGIDKSFQEQVRDYVKPGTSALFMMIERATPDEAILLLSNTEARSSRHRCRTRTRNG